MERDFFSAEYDGFAVCVCLDDLIVLACLEPTG